jgi:hypothetical protein
VTANDDWSANVKTRRTCRSWLRRIGRGLLILLIFSVCTRAWRHHAAQQRLDETLRELDRTDPGWRLEDIEVARDNIPEEENSARIVVAAGKLLPRDWPPKALGDLFTHLAPAELLSPEDFATLKQGLESIRPALDEAHKLARMPRGRHRIVYERNTLQTLLKDQAETRRIATLLALDALVYNQNGDGTKALASCAAVLNAARSLGDEPTTISQLIRSACVIVACQAIERSLARNEPPPKDLTNLQRNLEMEDAHPDLLIVMRGERAMSHALFNAIESGDVSLNGLVGVRWDWFHYALISIWRLDTYDDHVLMLSLMARAIANAQLPMHEQIEAERQLDQAIQEVRHQPRPPLLTGLLMPTMSKQGESSRRKHANLRCTIAALAAERYRQAHKKWPDSLDKLCPQFMDAVPLDPFNGESIRYRRTEDGVIIYSVGSDRTDDSGNLDPAHPNQPGVDIGFRLWDVAKRRQPPRPKAPDEEQPR